MDRRDAPNVEPIPDDQPPTNPGRRFARLVQSHASRKVALPRLLVAVVLGLSFLALIGMGVAKMLESAARWVDQQPEHQLRFGEIELNPPPDPWIRGGAEVILEQVRNGAKLGETISLLDLDLKGIEQDFRRSPWIKDVLGVDRSHYRRLIVNLVYRKPVAILEYGPAKSPFVLDDEAVVLSDKVIDWASQNDPYRLMGMDRRLIKILRLPESLLGPSLGLPIKRKVEGGSLDIPDPLVLGAARLARFLLDRGPASPAEPPIEFDQIYLPEDLNHPFFLRDSRGNWVRWGPAPGEDKPPEPSAEAKWTMLREWVKTKGPLDMKPDEFLHFTNKGAYIRRSSSPSR